MKNQFNDEAPQVVLTSDSESARVSVIQSELNAITDSDLTVNGVYDENDEGKQ